MSINTYLRDLASNLVISSEEKNKINTSVNTLETRLESWFEDIEDKFIFGSYTRNTILPRKCDENSDIDYMIVFKDDGVKAQTYLDRLKRFVEHYYSTSEIHRSFPTIVLELNHIKFELVPAINSSLNNYYKIPDNNNNQEWMLTSPNDINSSLSNANQKNNNMIKPIVRLTKYWNIEKCSRNFISYTLEKNIISDLGYAYIYCTNYIDYIKKSLESLKNHTNETEVISKINTAIDKIEKAIELENDNMPISAMIKIKEVFPEA